MPTWILYAILAMFFAGITSILAKYCLAGISADFGLGIRTTVIFVIIASLNLAGERLREFSNLTALQAILLVASGITTSLSWIFYYRAMKDGLVSYVAAIDKASILITLVLSFVLLKEPVTLRVVLGGILILGGMLVLVWK